MTKPAQFATVPDCPPVPYSSNELVCPAGGYSPGRWRRLVVSPGCSSSVGPPTNTTSDLPNRAMYGGYIIIPAFCTATISLRDYMPNIVHPEALNHPSAVRWRSPAPTTVSRATRRDRDRAPYNGGERGSLDTPAVPIRRSAEDAPVTAASVRLSIERS